MTGIVKGIFGIDADKTGRSIARLPSLSIQAPGIAISGPTPGRSFTTATRTPATQGALDRLQTTLRSQAGAIRGLRPQVRPGFGRLTEARVGAIDRARGRTIGNLRQELARRRILGSSFAQNEIARQEAEFGREEERARAESFLQELDLSARLIGEEFKASTASAQVVLGQLNFETEIAMQLGTAAQTTLSTNAQAMSNIRQAAQQDASGLLASLIGFAAGGGIGGVGSLADAFTSPAQISFHG